MSYFTYMKHYSGRLLSLFGNVVQYGCLMHVTVEYVADFVVVSY